MAKMTEALGVENVESLDKNDYMEFRNELKANGSLSSKFDEEFFNSVYPGSGYKAYVASVNEDLGKIIEDAKAGNEYAECYLIIAARKMCYYIFWKVFIGSAASGKVIKARLDNGDFSDFIGIMYIAFDKAIKSFKPKVYKDGTMKIGNWQYWFGQYLRMDAISENVQRAKDPNENALNPDGMDDSEKGGATAWDKLTGDNATELDVDDFSADWRDFCNDPEMNESASKKVNVPKRKILAMVLKGKSIPEIASELDVAKNTIYAAMNVGDLMKKYNIDQGELAQKLHNDPDFIIGCLEK
jgi:hypothetical protein